MSRDWSGTGGHVCSCLDIATEGLLGLQIAKFLFIFWFSRGLFNRHFEKDWVRDAQDCGIVRGTNVSANK